MDELGGRLDEIRQRPGLERHRMRIIVLGRNPCGVPQPGGPAPAPHVVLGYEVRRVLVDPPAHTCVCESVQEYEVSVLWVGRRRGCVQTCSDRYDVVTQIAKHSRE